MKRSRNHIQSLSSGIVRGIGIGIGIGIGLTTTALLAVAASMNLFSSGEVISSAKLNENFEIAAPVGGVMAFNLPDCPKGWALADGTSGTPDLRGRFIRGIDGVGLNRDPFGVRAPGAYQPDAFQGHFHEPLDGAGFRAVKAPGLNGFLAGAASLDVQSTTGKAVSDGTNGDPRFAPETRPANIALIYCVRKNAP